MTGPGDNALKRDVELALAPAKPTTIYFTAIDHDRKKYPRD